MKVNIFHNGQLIEASNWLEGTTPDGVKHWHKRHSGKYGYDVMIGAVTYYVKSCNYSNNDTEIIMKVSRRRV